MDWKSKAKELRFSNGLSWKKIAIELQEQFPNESEHEIIEKIS